MYALCNISDNFMLKKLFVVYLKFKFNWVSYLLFGNLTSLGQVSDYLYPSVS